MRPRAGREAALARPPPGEAIGRSTTRDYDQAVPDEPPQRLCLPSGSRLRRHADVRKVFDFGRSAAVGAVVAYAFPRSDAAPPRYALVVGKRWGDAVRRNRIRRLLRESFRLCRPELPCGFDVILLPRDPLRGARLADVLPQVRQAVHAAARRFRRDGPAEPRPEAGRRRRR